MHATATSAVIEKLPLILITSSDLESEVTFNPRPRLPIRTDSHISGWQKGC